MSTSETEAKLPEEKILTARTAGRWITGILGSWLIVWLLGPLVLDSILIRTYDPALDVNTLRPGDVVYWRSEGWGRTLIGPHGLPGWQPRVDAGETNVNSTLAKVVIWGDSQVEGVCVDDPLKIHNQAIGIAQSQHQLAIDCLPMGRSGADARDWQDLIAAADNLWKPDLHVWIVTDLSDLTVAVSPEAAAAYRRWTVESPAWVRFAKQIQAQALIAASKRVLRDPDTGAIRRLDFSLGPRNYQNDPKNRIDDQNEAQARDERIAEDVASMMLDIAKSHDGRIAILYAPATPRFSGGVVTDHPDDAAFTTIRQALESQGLAIADCRQDFIDLWRSKGQVARGFHNGMPSYGHLNAEGNRIVAEKIVAMLQERLQR